jgi:regulator of sigma E protease
MIINLIYVFLAILGLSFLIFIHELGHYWMARRVGMRVETFAIGFGRPIYSWTHQGVRWQIGWLLFGGYVKIAGQELEEGQDPYQIPDGYFGRPPWERIKVAFMGPFVNLVFALLVFAALWVMGGREKNFSEFTHKIGWVDPRSELYTLGVRPGDEIIAYNDESYKGSNDHLEAPMVSRGKVQLQGFKVNYVDGDKQPFSYTVKTYPHPASLDRELKTSGILSPANYMIYDYVQGQENPLPEGSPLQGSGIQYGDRIVWVDGETVFSSAQLNHLLNDGRALLTIKRGNQTLLRRVPRVYVDELRLNPAFREELVDWQFEAQLKGTRIQKLLTIPYDLTNDAVVESDLKFIDKEKQEEAFPTHPYSSLEAPLEPGDHILAVDGALINRSHELLGLLQQHRVYIIVERDPEISRTISWKSADSEFDQELSLQNIQHIASSIGTSNPILNSGHFYLLKPVAPKMRVELALSPEKQAWLTTEFLEKKKEIEAIDDPEKRSRAMNLLEATEKQLLIGLSQVQDRHVIYNPSPFQLFRDVFRQIWNTLTALVTGTLNPKWISGPIGIVQIVQQNWILGLREAFFWLGAISLNLGILNLLPIPVLDGGNIVLSLFEMMTRRKINPKTIEKIIIPFAILLIGFFVFLTYNDLSRIFGGLWR